MRTVKTYSQPLRTRYGMITVSAGIVLALMLPQTLLAVVANRSPFEAEQPDGTKITLHVRGDEYNHWFEDLDGFTVLRTRNGQFVYARKNAKGELVPTPFVVGKDNPRAAGLVPQILPSIEQMQAARHKGLGGRTISANDLIPHSATPHGTVKNLVILALFNDHQLGQDTYPREAYEAVYDTEGGHATYAPTGSVRDYYEEISYNDVTMESTVLEWVTLPGIESDYAGVLGAMQMVIDALELVNPLVDFSEFDTDGDGQADSVTVVHSGRGAEFGGSGIWSHRGIIVPAWQSGDSNVFVEYYNTVAALHGASGYNLLRIGVCVHELAHNFGLPDLYDGDQSSSGIGSWGLMANSWGWDGSGLVPPHASAWSKFRLEWVEPTVLSSPGRYPAPQVETNPVIYQVTKGYECEEYLLIENRQPVGFDSQIPQGGIAIWHIDELVGTMFLNDVNTNEGHPGQAGWPENGNHYRVALLQADALFDLEQNANNGDEDDLFQDNAFGINEWGVEVDSVSFDHPNTNGYQSGIIGVTYNSISETSPSGTDMTFVYGYTAERIGGIYVVHDLGTLPGDTQSRAYDINNPGQVAGYSGPENQAQAFLWLPEPAFGLDVGMHDIHDSTAFSLGYSNGYGINDGGYVVGRAKADDGEWHAFAWDPNTQQMTDLHTYTPYQWYPIDCTIVAPGSPDAYDCDGARDFSEAYDINSNGQAVGYTHEITRYWYNGNQYNGTYFYLGARWDLSSSGHIDVTPRIGWPHKATAWGINDNSEIVGYYWNDPFIWSSGTGMVILPTDGLSREATSINNVSLAVGLETLDRSLLGTPGLCDEDWDPFGSKHGLLWDCCGIFDLDSWKVKDYSEAYDINDAGVVVGWRSTSHMTGAEYQHRACLWRSLGTSRWGKLDLTSHAMSTDGSVWELVEARGINESEMVVGWGQQAQGPDYYSERAYLLRPGVDCNNNGVPDQGEVIDGPYDHDCNDNGVPDECEGSMDGDFDCDIDLDDHAAFVNCMTGPGLPYPPGSGCIYFDSDVDGDVDMFDWAQLQILFGSIPEYCPGEPGYPAEPCGGGTLLDPFVGSFIPEGDIGSISTISEQLARQSSLNNPPVVPPAVILWAETQKNHSGAGLLGIDINVGGTVEAHDLTTESRMTASGVLDGSLKWVLIKFDQDLNWGLITGEGGVQRYDRYIVLTVQEQYCAYCRCPNSPGYGTQADYVAYSGGSGWSFQKGPGGDDELLIGFNSMSQRGLEPSRTYKLILGPAVTSASAQQTLEIRTLRGDVNEDCWDYVGDGLVNNLDLAIYSSELPSDPLNPSCGGISMDWIPVSGSNAHLDIDLNGWINHIDRLHACFQYSGGWAGGNCAP